MYKSNHYNFGQCCRTLRKNKGLTIKEACNGICDEGTLSRIENGKHFPHEKTLDQICERLGEENLIERYIMGEKYKKVQKKRDLKKSLSHSISIGEIDGMEEDMLELRRLINNPVSEDMQFFLTVQNIWLKMKGAQVSDSSKKYIEIYEMKKSFPKVDDNLREIITKGTFSHTDHLLINCVGLSLIEEQKTNSACKVLIGLYMDINEKLPKSPKNEKKLAVAACNCAVAMHRAKAYEQALEYAKRAFDYGLKTMDFQLVSNSVKVEIAILRDLGFDEDADLKEKYIAQLQKMFDATLDRHKKKRPIYFNSWGIPIL